MVEALDLGTLNKRLKREKAQSGEVTASLIWNDPSDLDLRCEIIPTSGKKETIFFGNKKAAGGYLDVDMNASCSGKGFSLEPVENIFFKSPPGGKYTISVNNFGTRSDPTKWKGKYTNDNRLIPFKVFLNKDGKMQTFSGKAKGRKYIKCFSFSIKGGGGGGGSGGGGCYIVFPPEASQVTFKALCAKHRIPWKQGSGYYAVARTEKIHSYKEMLLQNVKADKFTVGAAKCRKALGWPEGELRKGPKDIKDGHRLFVQSTSANRVIPGGTHVLFEVTPEEYAKHKKARSTKYEGESHTTGKKGSSAAAKAKAKPKAKGAAKAKAKAKAKATPAPRAGAKRAAAPPMRAGGGGGLRGKKLVFTGTLEVPRSTATAAAQAAGAAVIGAVSANMDILVAGPGAGSKLAKAEGLGKEVWNEAKFKRAAGL